MANVLFKRGVQAQLPQSGAIDGAFYLTTDTHRLYYGNSSGTCDLLSQAIIEVATVQDLANQPLAEGQFYYVTGSNILAIRHNNAWVQINPDTRVVQTNGSSNTEFTTANTASSTNSVTVTLTIAQTKADGNNPSPDVAASFALEGAGGVEVTRDGSVVTITGALLDVEELLDGNNVHQGASITLGDSQVDLVQGNNISITSSGDAITIAGTDNYVNSATATIDYGTNGVGYEIGGTLGRTGNLGTVTAQAATLDPVIDYGYGGIDDNTNEPIRTASAHFVNDHAELDVYTRAQVDALVDASLYELNAMTYKGTVGSSTATAQTLPTTGVRIGDTWLADSEVTVNNTTYPAGTMFVANGSETNGVITSNLSWSAVQTSDRDTHYKGIATAIANNGGGKLDIVTDDSSQTIVGTTQITTGVNAASSDTTKSIVITMTPANDNKEADFVIAHKQYVIPDSTPTTQTKANAGQNTTIEFVSGITAENGHVTGIGKTSVEIENTVTQVTSVSAAASNATVSGGSGATVTTTVETGDGASLSESASGAFTVESTSLAVSGANSAVTINLEWGSFPSNS